MCDQKKQCPSLTQSIASASRSEPALLHKQLEQYAESTGCRFLVDRTGNILLTHPGQDDSLSAIALIFPLSGDTSKNDSMPTIRVFEDLLSSQIACDITLVLWVAQDYVGKEDDLLPRITRSGIQDLLSFSAMLQFSEIDKESDTDNIRLHGSPVLVSKAQENLSANPGSMRGANVCVVENRAAQIPFLQLQCIKTIELGVSLVKAYSDYIVDLFDNFD